MYRRKRRNRGTWLPTLGTQMSEDDSYLSGFGFGIGAPVDTTTISTIVYPITADSPTYQGDSVGQNTTMAEVIGNEYFLDRIVGKLFLMYEPARDVSGNTVNGPVLVASGFFVARADDNNPLTPIGAGSAQEVRDNYSPLDLDTIREPWIWRRAWMLGTSGNARLGGGISLSTNWDEGAFPSSNTLCGSVLDGPHIDAKTKRRVGQEDRLWWALAVARPIQLFTSGTPTTNGEVKGYLDYRLHGQLRRARPDGRF